jgi:hypothetical protein
MTATQPPPAEKIRSYCLNVRSGLAPLAIALALSIPPACVRAQSPTDEYRVKAAFIFHFAQLVDWPENTAKSGRDQFAVCILGDDPFHGALEESMSGKTIDERPVRINHAKAPAEIQGCRVLFVGDAEMKRFPSILTGLKDEAVLTIGDTEDFVLQRGGIIGFCLEDNKIRFDVNLDIANRAKLKISSRILLLAKVVIGTKR